MLNSDSDVDIKIAVVSSVSVFAITSLSFFVVGFLCGHFCQIKKEASCACTAYEHENTSYNHSNETQCHNELELKENVAYAQVLRVQ